MYFVITNKKEQIRYYNFQLKTGLNILNMFNRGRLCYFVDIKNTHDIHNTYIYYEDWNWIRPVIFASDANTIKYYDKFKTDKIIMGDRFPLYSLKTIKTFNLNITYDYIMQVCKRGNVDILEWWKNSGLKLEYDKSTLDLASSSGQVKVLEWWKNSDLKLKYTNDALDWASSNGHVEVLEWWKNSGLELKYNTCALDLASSNSHVEVLEWWKNSGLELKYTVNVLDWASRIGHVNVLEWWKNSGL
jgi:hypothetical protein